MDKYFKIFLGSDPEFFYKKDGKVIGAEKVLGQLPNKQIGLGFGDSGKVIIDGVQAELNPTASDCRESHLFFVGNLLRDVRKKLPPGVTAHFDQLVDIDKSEMESLSKNCQQFGCTPSFNVYGAQEVEVRDASKYFKRSAGGHIHLGYNNDMVRATGILEPSKLVPILDIIVGNTCVLLDRSEGNKERRKNYGRAGEYRTPKYGIEYRTLSNFWLDNYIVAHLVFGLCRQAVNYVANGMDKEILRLVDQKDIIKAINENDFDLALENFKKIVPILRKTPNNGAYPLNYNSIVAFLFLVEKGYKNVFPCGIEQWENLLDTWFSKTGFENWANAMDYKLKKEKVEYYNSLVESLK